METTLELKQKEQELQKQLDEVRKQQKEAEEKNKITVRVKTVEDAIVELGENHEEVILLRKLQKAEITGGNLATQEIVVFNTALNEGTVLDPIKGDTRWFPVFIKDSAGSGLVFCFSVYSDDCAFLNSASRLALKSRELSDYSAACISEKYFIAILPRK